MKKIVAESALTEGKKRAAADYQANLPKLPMLKALKL